jgi:hypothetical protein
MPLRVEGYREFMRATARADSDLKRYVRSTLRDVGEIVRLEAAARFAPVDIRSATGYRTSVTQRGVAVYQSIPKVTGNRPDYGRLQMRRALLPAAYSNRERVEQKMEEAIDKVATQFNSDA